MNPASLVRRTAAEYPDRVAIAARGFQMRYADLVDAAGRFAQTFRTLGIHRQDIVGVAVRPEVEAVVSLALLQLGAVSLSLTPAVLRGYGSNLDWLISDQFVPGGTARWIPIDTEFLSALGGVRPLTEDVALSDSDLVRIVFTSGTTGTPKGVPFTVELLRARVGAAHSNWISATPFLSMLGIDTAIGMQTMFWSFFTGQTFLVAGNAETQVDLIRACDVRAVQTSPSRLKDLLDRLGEVGGTLPLEHIDVVGSLLSPALGRRCISELGITPTYLYASTEVGAVTRGTFNPDDPSAVGSPVADVNWQLVGDDGAVVVGAGEVGRIRARKSVMPNGYWREVPGSSSVFHDGWFIPGDIGRVADGVLHIHGRADDVVNIDGVKFNLLELDGWLAELSGFTDAAGYQFTEHDGAARVGVAVVTELPLDGPEIVRRVRDHLPNIPIHEVVKLAEIPRNPQGKVERTVLTALRSSNSGTPSFRPRPTSESDDGLLLG